MINEEARIIVEQLDNYLSHTCQDYGERDHEAMTIAIKALEQEPCEDAISREDALMCMTGEYIADMTYKPEDIISKHIQRLRALPSVQPKPVECEDAISMMDLLNNLHKHFSKGFETDEWWNSTHVLQTVKDCRPELFDLNYVSSVQPKPKTGHCKDCKYFEYDHFENMGGIPLITAHKVCKRHGLICKTDEDGYCHLFEHKAESEET